MTHSDQGRRELVVLGGGGHAKVVIATAMAAGFEQITLYDDAHALHGAAILGCSIVGSLGEAPGGVLGALALGDNAVRRDCAGRYPREWVVLVHPQTSVHRSVQLGSGTVVFAGAVVQPDTRLGGHVIVNTGATIDHDCAIGDYAHVAPGACLAGGVSVGEGALIGLGARITPGVRIGDGATVGAGAVVTHDVPALTTVVGVPAAPVVRR